MYIEELIIENLIINIIILSIYLSFLDVNVSKMKFAFLVIFISLLNILIKIFCNNSVIITILANITYIYIIESKIEIKKYIKRIIYYNVIYYFTVGYIFFIIIIFNLNISNILNRIIVYCISGLFIKISIDMLWKMWINKIKYKDNVYNLNIENIGNFKMFYDTGNFASFENGVPVIVMNINKYIKKLKKNNKYIETRKSYSICLKTISGKKEYKGYVYENMTLKKEGEKEIKILKSVIVFTDEEIVNNIFDGILPFNILIEK